MRICGGITTSKPRVLLYQPPVVKPAQIPNKSAANWQYESKPALIQMFMWSVQQLQRRGCTSAALPVLACVACAT